MLRKGWYLLLESIKTRYLAILGPEFTLRPPPAYLKKKKKSDPPAYEFLDFQVSLQKKIEQCKTYLSFEIQ